MNKFQKYLNKKTKQMVQTYEKSDYWNYSKCKKQWKYALIHFTHYQIMLRDMNIRRR